MFEKNGIAYGSCWDERIAGTNGISMALSEGKAFTVRGKDDSFSLLHPFSCTAVPLFDAENQLIGVVNFSML
ncbi:GAF domain-containing protein, partial [Staphylococcus pasteuri_A]|uniref:GAF domain-containing protein n=1 Tax=Staphylococcus pasteuri_A TaxID=3062664 RepID=UPI0026E3B796